MCVCVRPRICKLSAAKSPKLGIKSSRRLHETEVPLALHTPHGPLAREGAVEELIV